MEKEYVLHILSVCVCVCVCVALVTRHAMHLRPCCHLWPVQLCHIFLHSLTNGAIFVIERKMCVLVFFAIFENFLVLRKIERDIIVNVHRSPCKLHSILVRF
jgi:hypothetical protein